MASRVRPRRLGKAPLAAPKTPMPEVDLAAFYQQVYAPLVRRATWRHRLSAEDARDIVQDAFVLAIERIDATGNPKAWLIQVVDHLCLNHSRKAQRRQLLSARWGRGADALGSSKQTHEVSE
jgi:DNA-directed RNA polymerase specialized sigma24 family protein